MNLEVQLVTRSREGVVIPIARSDNPKLVRHVANVIVMGMEQWVFEDEVLNKAAERERNYLKQVLSEHGIEV